MGNSHGHFAVRLSICNGGVAAKLTGEHFRPGDSIPDFSAAQCEDPAYLIEDSAVAMAMRARDMAEKHGITKDEAFTRSVLWNVELQECDLSARLREALSDAIGSMRTHVPWNGDIDEKEINEILENAKGEQ